MDKLIKALLQIEYNVRMVREELAQELSRRNLPSLGLADFGHMVDVTPATWRNWFRIDKFKSPTPIGRYSEIFPDLTVGFADTKRPGVSVEQHMRSGGGSRALRSLSVRLIDKLDWLTLEFLIPSEVFKLHKSFHFAWSGALDSGQAVKLWLYETSAEGEEFRTLVDTRYFNSTDSSELYSIELSARDDVTHAKLYFDFEMTHFNLIEMNDARLLLPPDAAATG